MRVPERARRLERLPRLAEEGAAPEHVHVRVENGGQHRDRAAGRAQLGQPHAERRGVVLAEQDEDQHVGGHRHRQHQRPVEPAPPGEVVEGDERGQRAAEQQRPDADAGRQHERVAQRVGQQRRRDRVERLALAEERRGQDEQRCDHERRDRDRGDRPAGAAAYSHPTRCIISTAVGEQRPGLLDVDRVGLHARPVADVLGRRHVRVGGELAVLHDRLLRLTRGEELHQADRVRALLAGALDEPDARHVGVGAGAVLVGPRGRDREVRVVLELAGEVVVVGEPDVAVAGGDRLEHVDVGAEDLRLVGHDRLEQLLGLRLAVLGDPVGDPRLVVLVVARAQADAAAELGLGEVGVARDGALVDALGRAHRDAQARADPPPGAVGIVQLDVRVELDRLEQPGLLGAPEVRQVGRHEQVGLGRVALAAQPLEQLGRGAAAQLDVEPRLLLERLEGLLVAVLRAAVVDDDVGRSGEREGRHAEAGDDHQHGGGDEAKPAAASSALG